MKQMNEFFSVPQRCGAFNRGILPPPPIAFLVLLCGLIGRTAVVSAQSVPNDGEQLAVLGSNLARTYCYDCHGLKFNGSSDFDVLQSDRLRQFGYVVVGAAEDSPMWQRIASGEMPPEDAAGQLGDDEKLSLRHWIEAGAPQPTASPARKFKSRDSLLSDIYSDLNSLPTSAHIYQRYFDLSHLWNNPSVSDRDLRTHLAAISKLVNSLSWEFDIVLPTRVDEAGTVLRIDLRKLGWSSDQWNSVIAKYPYGTKPHGTADQRINRIAAKVMADLGTEIGIVRADWFVATASRPPLYDLFLELPNTAGELETKLGVDFGRNFTERRVQRAGFTTSGVSRGNRLVERHPSRFGYYWKSYDFRDGGDRVNLFRFPLGPKFDRHPFPDLAFDHDGGELIFSLPNGLQGYMLVDQRDRKIDVGPIDVVRDVKEIGGSTEVVNGISCMHCHAQGMIRFTDTVRGGHALSGMARQVVEELHPDTESMAAVVLADTKQFRAALDKAVSPFLNPGGEVADEPTQSPIDANEEPIGSVARRYHRDLDLQTATFELGLPESDLLRTVIETNHTLARLGLRPLGKGAAVKRAEWENSSGFTTTFQEASRVLQLGTPVIFSDR